MQIKAEADVYFQLWHKFLHHRCHRVSFSYRDDDFHSPIAMCEIRRLNLTQFKVCPASETRREYFDTLWTILLNIWTAKHGGRDSSARIFASLHVTDANCRRWMIRVAIRTFAQKSSPARHEHRLLRVELLYWRADCKEKQESSLINHLVTYIQRRVVNNPKKASHDKRHDEWEREKNKLKSIAKCVQCHTQSVQLKVKKRPRLSSRRFLCFSRYTFEFLKRGMHDQGDIGH